MRGGAQRLTCLAPTLVASWSSAETQSRGAGSSAAAVASCKAAKPQSSAKALTRRRPSDRENGAPAVRPRERSARTERSDARTERVDAARPRSGRGALDTEAMVGLEALPLPARDAVVRFLPPVDALRALPFVSEDTLAALQELFGYPSGGSRISRSRTRHDRPTRLPGTSARSTFPTIFCTTNRSTSRDWQAARRCTRSTSHAFKLWVRRRCLALRRCTRLPSARRESLTSRRCRAALPCTRSTSRATQN